MAFSLSSSSSDSSNSDEDLTLVSSSSEEELPRRSRSLIRRVNYMQSLDDAEFTFRFRLTKPAVEFLLAEIMPFVRVTSTRNFGISPLHQLLMSLRFYALGTMLISVADFVGVSIATACRIVRDISSAVSRLYDRYIFMHQNSAANFYTIAGFPRVLGAIDCTHVRIQSPCHLIGEEFRNRKGYFSLNVQAVCDADLRLMNVVARWPGSAHDATIFNNSMLKAQCDSGEFGNRWLLGDSAYPNTPYLLTPLLNPSTVGDHRYNEAHIKTRNTIERTFGVWKRRFPVISLTLRLSLPNIQAVVIATAVLHNICRNMNLEDVPSEIEMPAEDNIEERWPEELNISQRADLINNFFS
ncbi:putative nuclease HARBI1 [Ostrinia nubilalis]|uniref:putative nuclease HARBI1 n=1 Tax=Ostrinia nubilalis TaxID=29057 RepID=UPI0030823B99